MLRGDVCLGDVTREQLGDRPVVPNEHDGPWGAFACLSKLAFAADLQWRRR